MKKYILALITILSMVMNVSAQIMEIYKDDVLVTTYDASQANRVVFKEDNTQNQPKWYIQESTGKTYDSRFVMEISNALEKGYIDTVFERKTGRLLNNKYDLDLYSKAIRIINDNTLAYYNLELRMANGSIENLPDYLMWLQICNCGVFTYFFSEPTYYTYASLNGKIIVSNGDIYTLIGDELIPDGSSTKYKKRDGWVDDKETFAAWLKDEGFDYTDEVLNNVSVDYDIDYNTGWMTCNFKSSISGLVETSRPIKWGVAGLEPEVQDYFSELSSDTHTFNLYALSFLDPETAEDVISLNERIEILTKRKEEGKITSDELWELNQMNKELDLFESDIRKTMRTFHGYIFVMINGVKYSLDTF